MSQKTDQERISQLEFEVKELKQAVAKLLPPTREDMLAELVDNIINPPKKRQKK